ncbi:prolyl oligopeptidase family serine peptidase [Actinopolymorpha pittospori]
MAEPVWVQRFQATNFSFPDVARDAPGRCLYQSNSGGTAELYVWDRELDLHAQVTARRQGTRMGRISPDGEWVWWYADTDGDERGLWMRQPFEVSGNSTDAVPAVPGLAPAHPAGLALGLRCAVVGLSDRDGSRIVLHRHDADDARPTTIYAAPRYATVGALSYDETLVAIQHSEHGDAFTPAVRVFRVEPEAGPDVGPDGTTVGDLWDGPGHGLHVVGFAPRHGDGRLLLRHERSDRSEPLIWDLHSDSQVTPAIDLPGELYPSWYPDGRALLIRRHWQARDELYRYDLDTGKITALPTPAGVIGACAVRPNGTVEYAWSSGERPQVLLADSGTPVLTSPRPAPPSVPLVDAWVAGPGGRVHALVARPDDERPAATVFLLHGGPGGQVTDSFWPARAAFVDAGYCVIHVNYRGSSGYGARWRDADREAPGLIELEDVAAVRDWAVRNEISDPDRCVIAGISWGGYLTLLGLGVQPKLWAAGVAEVPIGDLVALYEDEMEPVREHDRSLFGGTPEELPDKWRRSNPISYVDHVTAPVLVLASRNDPRCPIRGVENYLERLTELGKGHETYLFDAGHFSVVADERIHQMWLQLDFCLRTVPPIAPATD